MIQKKTIRHLLLTGVTLSLFLAWGCTKPPVSPVPPPPEKKEEKKETVSLIPILMAEAEKFADMENFQDALLIYNQALDKAMEKGVDGAEEKKQIIDAIETTLGKTPPQTIEEFAGIRNLTIPLSVLRYWLGYNYAAGEDYALARPVLESFINDYPGHPHAAGAKDILKSIKQLTFNRDTIGCLLPLSGKYKVYGQKTLRGIQLAVRDLSEKFGRPFKVVVKDTRSDPDHAALCVEELARENVLGIVGPLLVPEAAGKQAQEMRIPLIALTQKSEFPLQGDYLFSNFITPEMQVQSLGSYIFMELGLKKVAILYPEERYGKRYMELFWNVVDEFNGEVVGVESYDGTKTDFTVPLQKLTGEYYPVPEFLIPEEPEPESPDGPAGETDGEMSDPEPASSAEPAEASQERRQFSSRSSKVANEDRLEIDFEALFIPDAPSRVNLILPQLAFNDARGMVLLGTNLWHQKSLLTQARGYNKNAVISDGYFGESRNPVTADFDKGFREVFQEPPGFLEAIAYDTANILFTAAMNPEVDSREGLKETLQGRQMFDGVTGQTIFDNTGSPHKELFLLTVKRGKFREISR
ncbi:MAG: penicillin-binding protein activator [Desulfobacterales bacterium]|nr:penicillin-binding protein activator [Desulfobacterales bacterium]